jgi:hypothetical protein
MNIKSVFTWITIFFIAATARAGEGMWLPLLLEQLNQKEMQDMGMRISASDIYDVNHSSLKDAIALFGGGCTAEVVSDKGLILTNHHCGYGRIQNHSSIEHDYLRDGFWAATQDEELPNPGLTVSFLIRMENVSVQALDGILPAMNENQRKAKIIENCTKIQKAASEGNKYQVVIRPFYAGNEFYLLVYEVFSDVRLVGAPPSNIGKFGGDTDNWMWPRHTGDFSVFRIYADQNNNPAPYSKENRPYKPKKHLTISLKGVDKGDFTMVFGYPGTTQEYLPADAIQMTTGLINPVRINMRQIRLDIMHKSMDTSNLMRIQYSAKYAGIANSWKKWQGENLGIKRMNAIEKKREYENRFNLWCRQDAERNEKYGTVLSAFAENYDGYSFLKISETYLTEAGLGIEIVKFARSFDKLLTLCSEKPLANEKIAEQVKLLVSATDNFYKDYQPAIDQEIMTRLLAEYAGGKGKIAYPDVLVLIDKKYKGDFDKYTKYVFEKSLFADKNRLTSFLADFKPSSARQIARDPAFILAKGLLDHYKTQIESGVKVYEKDLDSLQRIFMFARMQMEPDKLFYPDANSTLRIAYGKVDNYKPRDGTVYQHYTTLAGIIEKEDPSVFDYVVEPRLKQLYNTKDYGRYANKKGEMQVAFTASNHTTGGNSGSPVLNADGQLVGINFDRNWEGTMSDLMYDPEMCRNISLDIRYCLFIIDIFAGAGHLVQEMTIAE